MNLDEFETLDEAVEYVRKEIGCKGKREAVQYIRDKLPLESAYQYKIIQHIKRKYPNAFIWKAVQGAYSKAGIPDLCVIIDGKFYGFEVKRPFFGSATIIQIKTLEKIRKAGGIAEIVRFPKDVEEIIERSRRG